MTLTSKENYSLSQEIRFLSHELYCWYTKDEYLLQEKEQSLLQEVHTVSRKKYWLCLTRKNYLWKFSSHDRKIFPVTGNFLLWQEMFPVTEYFSCDRKFFFSDRESHPVTENFFLWKKVFCCESKFLPVTRKFFLRQEISSCELSKKSRTFVVILRYDEKSRTFVAILYQIHSPCFKRNYLLEN